MCEQVRGHVLVACTLGIRGSSVTMLAWASQHCPQGQFQTHHMVWYLHGSGIYMKEELQGSPSLCVHRATRRCWLDSVGPFLGTHRPVEHHR